MINKKISKILGPAFGIMGFMLAIGLLETPALADDTVIKSSSAYTTTSAAVTYKDYSINLNKSVTQNGVKITLDKVTATKHKLQASVKIESSIPFDQNKDHTYIVQLLYGDNDYTSGGTSTDYIDDRTMLVNIEQGNDEEEFPVKGDLRLDVVLPKYKVNVGIDAYADFSESFEQSFHKDLSINIPNSDYTLNKLDSDVLGTTINYSGPYTAHSDRYVDSSFLFKVGDKIYKLDSSGSSSDGEKMEATYETKALTYDKFKNEKTVGLISLQSNITWDELDKIYKNNTTSLINNENKEILNNVNYDKSFDFSDGSKGEIYNIERNDTTVKIYCKGNSEKASILMASGMNIHYDFKEGQTDYVFYDSNNYMSFYKDPNDTLGYIVEFNNVDKDKSVNVFFNNTMKQIDRYTLGNEIQINK